MNTQTIYLHHSWKFHYGEEPDAWKKDYDDTIIDISSKQGYNK